MKKNSQETDGMLNPVQAMWSQIVSGLADGEERMRGAEAVGDFFKGFPPALLLPLLAGVAAIAFSH